MVRVKSVGGRTVVARVAPAGRLAPTWFIAEMMSLDPKLASLNTREGTTLVVIQFPEPWPVPESRLLLEANQGSARIALLSETDGSLTFVVADQDARREYRSQPLKIEGRGFAILSASWTIEDVAIRVNNEPLLGFHEAGGSVRTVRTSDRVPGVTPAWDDPSAVTACAEWVTWREQRFGIGKGRAAPGRRLKSHREQVQELTRAAQALFDLAGMIQQGHSHFFGHLAAELRALVFWNNRKTHNPLLLRLAGRKRVALPVYILPDKGPHPAPAPLFHVIADRPSIVKLHPNQVVADIQDWLKSTALIESDEANSAEPRRLSVLDTIAGVADSLGAAHYDEDVPQAVETLSSFRGTVGDQVTTLLLVAATVVISLSEHVTARVRDEEQEEDP